MLCVLLLICALRIRTRAPVFRFEEPGSPGKLSKDSSHTMNTPFSWLELSGKIENQGRLALRSRVLRARNVAEVQEKEAQTARCGLTHRGSLRVGSSRQSHAMPKNTVESKRKTLRLQNGQSRLSAIIHFIRQSGGQSLSRSELQPFITRFVTVKGVTLLYYYPRTCRRALRVNCTSNTDTYMRRIHAPLLRRYIRLTSSLLKGKLKAHS